MEPLALIIEDYEDQAMTFIEAVKRSGYSVEWLRDGLEAQERLRQVEPSLVVLDLHLPKVSGGALLAQIRSDPRTQDTTVFLLTADAQQAEYLAGSANLVLLKPVSFIQLRDLATRFYPMVDENSSEG